MPTAPRLLALAGPTASGKTDAALALAARLPCEIVSVDSALVYRGMDIGTAKPTAAERAAVPHHLIDIRDPSQAYSAAEFANDARRLVDEINARGRVALLVGGTMLYLKALFEGLDAMPRYTSAESTLTISHGRRAARASAASVLPEAVGPARASSRGAVGIAREPSRTAPRHAPGLSAG